MVNGKPYNEAIEIGKKKAAKAASCWADIARSGNALASSFGVNFPPLTKKDSDKPKGQKMKNNLSKVSPFMRGRATTDSDDVFISQKPEYLKNKCLVIRGLKKGITRAQFRSFINETGGRDIIRSFINETAGRDINVFHDVCISREYSKWLTVAIEISENDYETLSDPNIWNNNIQIRDFIGRRWWRPDWAKKMTTKDIKNSMRMQWS